MPRRTFTLLVVVAGMTIAVVPAAAADRKPRRVERVVEARYSAPAPGVTVGGEIYGACVKSGIGCVEIAPRPTELFVRIEVVDTTGASVHALVEHVDGNTEVCGKTEEPIRLRSAEPFLVWIFEGPCGDGRPASSTSGKVVATLASRP